MKTSTKLLIIFFVSIPVSLWSYNILLKKQLDAGNLTLELRPDPNQTYVLKPMPAFKHLVVDGVLTLGTGKDINSVYNWNPHFNIGDNGKKSTINAVKILDKYEDAARMQVRNDTLYISFHRNKAYKADPYTDYQFYGIELFKVQATNLQSVTVSSAGFKITSGVQGINALNINLSNSNMEMMGFTLPGANISADNGSTATVANVTIDNLNYSLQNKSHLVLNLDAAKHVHAGTVDSLSWITIEGKANVLQGFLTK